MFYRVLLVSSTFRCTCIYITTDSIGRVFKLVLFVQYRLLLASSLERVQLHSNNPLRISQLALLIALSLLYA